MCSSTDTQTTVKSSFILFDFFHNCSDSHLSNHILWIEENMLSNNDDMRPRVIYLLFVMSLIDEVKSEGIIPFNRSMKHRLLLIELRSHIVD